MALDVGSWKNVDLFWLTDKAPALVGTWLIEPPHYDIAARRADDMLDRGQHEGAAVWRSFAFIGHSSPADAQASVHTNIQSGAN